MGYLLHHAIIVTSSSRELLVTAHATAFACGCCVSNIVNGKTNNQGSFLIAPDGSKEGWSESHDGDRARNRFVEWADAQRYADGSSSLDWSEIVVGGDDNDSYVVRHQGQMRRIRAASNDEGE